MCSKQYLSSAIYHGGVRTILLCLHPLIAMSRCRTIHIQDVDGIRGKFIVDEFDDIRRKGPRKLGTWKFCSARENWISATGILDARHVLQHLTLPGRDRLRQSMREASRIAHRVRLLLSVSIEPLPAEYALALAMGLHGRLGRDSAVRLLDSDLLRIIVEFSPHMYWP